MTTFVNALVKVFLPYLLVLFLIILATAFFKFLVSRAPRKTKKSKEKDQSTMQTPAKTNPDSWAFANHSKKSEKSNIEPKQSEKELETSYRSFYNLDENQALFHDDSGVIATVPMLPNSFEQWLASDLLRSGYFSRNCIFLDLFLKNNRQKTSNYCQIDLVAVSRRGIFVIEAKDYTGWIFGDAFQKQWTETRPAGRGRESQKYRFLNPIRQNYGHN